MMKRGNRGGERALVVPGEYLEVVIETHAAAGGGR